MPDIDYGQILEALNDKVDSDGSWGFPAGQYDTLTLGNSGDEYTAPADGWFYLYGTYSSGNQTFVDMYVVGTGIGASHPWYDAFGNMRMFCPAKKGQKLHINYSGVFANIDFRFIYAQKTN